ncbi:MAG TPA: DUF2156 domain-containing protein [Polyangiaceae bacterium]|nr:DUF2156 domain-containing protein [Polyangiaceae bacterium]
MPHADDARTRVLAALERFGWNATSFQTLGSEFLYWFAADGSPVAYVDTGRAWVAAGAPIAPEAALDAVAREFAQAAKHAGRRVVFFATELRAAGLPGFVSLLIGEQPLWDPREFDAVVSATPSLREQLRRARAKGVSVTLADPREVAEQGAPLRQALEKLVDAWLATRPMPPMGFLVRVEPFTFASERRLFVARRGDELVGFAAVVPVYARNGWFIEDLIRASSAPNGTVEALVAAAMNDAATRGSDYMTLGLAPLAGSVTGTLRFFARLGSPLYDFSGIQAFKAKFRPREWVPIYLTYPADERPETAVLDALSAFSRRGLLSYGVEALLRGPAIVVRVLALLLVPWTLVMAIGGGPRWFPSLLVKWSWIALDIALCVALLALSRRWRSSLATTLLVVVALDALTTLGEVVLCDVPRIDGGLAIVIVLASVAAPAFATIVLWNARRRAARARLGATL